ncbi:hypothetical protein ACWJJH_03360 [Endozoicomonadaceae bacterium StTr2]
MKTVCCIRSARCGLLLFLCFTLVLSLQTHASLDCAFCGKPVLEDGSDSQSFPIGMLHKDCVKAYAQTQEWLHLPVDESIQKYLLQNDLQTVPSQPRSEMAGSILHSNYLAVDLQSTETSPVSTPVTAAPKATPSVSSASGSTVLQRRIPRSDDVPPGLKRLLSEYDIDRFICCGCNQFQRKLRQNKCGCRYDTMCMRLKAQAKALCPCGTVIKMNPHEDLAIFREFDKIDWTFMPGKSPNGKTKEQLLQLLKAYNEGTEAEKAADSTASTEISVAPVLPEADSTTFPIVHGSSSPLLSDDNKPQLSTNQAVTDPDIAISSSSSSPDSVPVSRPPPSSTIQTVAVTRSP